MAAAAWIAWLLLMAAGCLDAAHAEASLRITSAEFLGEGRATGETVALPDTWTLRGHPAGGIGHYHMRFHLEAMPQAVWALDADRLSAAHEVRLNGQLVHGSLDNVQRSTRLAQTLIPLPPKLLQVGENTLDISIRTGALAGMSALTVGPATALVDEHQRQQLRSVATPQLLNVAGAGISLFMLFVWARRRSDTVLGSFGALCLLASARNYAYFESGTVLPTLWSSWLYMMAQLVTALLLGVFAMGFAERRPPLYRNALLSLAVVFPPLSLLAVWADAPHLARLWLYPLLLTLLLAAVGLVTQAVWRRRALSEMPLVAGLACVLAAGVHDYLYQQGRLSVMGSFWMPYAVPLVVAGFSTLLIQRLVSALVLAESMNATLERRVAERTLELQVANVAKTRFLAAASHDLRQPMVSIGLLVALMQEHVGQGPMQRLVQRLQESTRAMEALLTRVLDLSRLQAGTVRVQRQALALQDVFGAVVAQHSGQAGHKGLRLRVRHQQATVDSDAALLEQIVGNLVGNAVRYTEQGGVLISARRVGLAHWRVAVWDTGPGIAPEQHEIIFGEFVRGEHRAGSAESNSGMGLGLAIVARAAALLDTSVVLRSRPGRGSCFSLLLPAADRVPVESPRPLPTAAPTTPLRGRKLWLLEDNVHARGAIQLLLQHWGAEVQAYGSMSALLGADDSCGDGAAPPDLLITDMRLPDGEGTESLSQLRVRWPELPVLIVTGNTAPQDLKVLEQWSDAGVPVLLKPFSPVALQSMLIEALAGAVD